MISKSHASRAVPAVPLRRGEFGSLGPAGPARKGPFPSRRASHRLARGDCSASEKHASSLSFRTNTHRSANAG